VSPSRLEALIAGALLMLALALLVPALEMPLGSAGNPGPGVLPLAVLVLLIGCSATLLIRHLLRGSARTTPAAAHSHAIGNRKIWFSLIALALTSLIFEPLGYRLSILLLLIALLRLYSTLSLARIAIAATIGTAAVWLFFERLLSVQLPAGLF
jgi:hypothetical protein